MKKQEVINFLEWYHSPKYSNANTTFKEDAENYLKFINSASNESLSVRDNEGKEKKCNWNTPEYRMPCYCVKLDCKECTYFY